MKKKILITDDDEGVQDVFKIIFERAGYDVSVQGNAFPIYEHQYTRPDLFLLDGQLRGHNGLDVCRFLKSEKETKNIPVIMVSATPGIGKMAQEAGANDFIEKPFRVNDLLQLVAKWI